MPDRKARLEQLRDEITEREDEIEALEQLIDAEGEIAAANARLAKMKKGT